MGEISDVLRVELTGCEGQAGFDATDGIFEAHGYGDLSFKEKTSILYHIMGVFAGGGTPGLSDEKVYILAKDLLASRDWKKHSCNECEKA